MEVVTYRELTPEEHDLLSWLLKNGPVQAKSFLPQLTQLRARSSCICGCPSIDFSVTMESAITQLQHMRVFFDGRSGNNDVGVMLTAKDGALSALEVYCYGGNEHSFSLPAIDTLRLSNVVAT